MHRWSESELRMDSIKEIIRETLKTILKEQTGMEGEPTIEVPPKPSYGDFASNIASFYPKEHGVSFDDFMDGVIVGLRSKRELFREVTRKGSFVNVFLNDAYLFGQLEQILLQGDGYARSAEGKGMSVLVEYVSTNPTGPLNVVNARAGVVGDVIVKLLNFTGYQADSEFYINDAGRQIDMLGVSGEARYQELLGNKTEIPEDGYKGEYIKDCIEKCICDKSIEEMDESERIAFFSQYLKDEMVAWQKRSLERFGVTFDHWVSERLLLKAFSIDDVVAYLRGKGDVYEKDGAIWFRTEQHGDDKDRVLIKQDGSHTYVVSDASYHKDKFERGYEHLINVWGPDHHGHVMRVKAAVEAFGFDPDHLEIIIVQQVSIASGGKKQKMSKRAGRFITLDSLLEEVDKDAVRFFFLMRKTTAHLDFDIELAKTMSLENPVYYSQYCHARTVNIISHAREQGIDPEEQADLSLLIEPQERELVKQMVLFPEVVQIAAARRDVHKIPYYLLDLSKLFHSYYQKIRVVTDDIPLSIARLHLVRAMQQVLKNCFALIGVTAPDRM
jgi:arginyl-tRNA synthetase